MNSARVISPLYSEHLKQQYASVYCEQKAQIVLFARNAGSVSSVYSVVILTTFLFGYGLSLAWGSDIGGRQFPSNRTLKNVN